MERNHNGDFYGDMKNKSHFWAQKWLSNKRKLIYQKGKKKLGILIHIISTNYTKRSIKFLEKQYIKNG